MDKFQITMFEAGNGDSFLIKCVGESITNILIDFGYSNTYKKHIEDHLISMASNNENLDLVIVTHIDQDHISGGIRFFEDNGYANNPTIIGVKEVWHNSYRHLAMAETKNSLSEKEKKHIISKSYIVEQNREGIVNDTSGKQGSRLAANLEFYNYNWNSLFDGKAVSYRKESICLNNDVKVIVLSPTIRELDKLRESWKKELKLKFPTIDLNNDSIFDDAVECITLMKRPKNIPDFRKNTSITTNLDTLASTIFQEDIDEINASSITCIIEFKGKKILLLGDSIPSTVEQQLKKIYDETGNPMLFDAIKVAHHGSAKNTSDELLNIIDSEHYFISTNGRVHGHPDIETIAKIINRKAPKGTIRNLYFTNKLQKIKIFDNKTWQKQYRYRTYYKNQSEDSLHICL
jgi:beta-lactamase superfamily II metal-dependent hydrolase